jgi:hypothetical protein
MWQHWVKSTGSRFRCSPRCFFSAEMGSAEVEKTVNSCVPNCGVVLQQTVVFTFKFVSVLFPGSCKWRADIVESFRIGLLSELLPAFTSELHNYSISWLDCLASSFPSWWEQSEKKIFTASCVSWWSTAESASVDHQSFWNIHRGLLA